MVAALDAAVANVSSAIQMSGMAPRTLMLFTTDNGGTPRTLASHTPAQRRYAER